MVSDWRPIESAPKDGGCFGNGRVILGTDGETVGAIIFANGRWCWASGEGAAYTGSGDDLALEDCYMKLTHWMPLPAPPGDGG